MLGYVGFAPYMGIYEQQPGIENHHKSLTKGIYTLMGNMMIDHDRPLDFWTPYFQTNPCWCNQSDLVCDAVHCTSKYSRQPRVMNRRGYGDLTMDASTARVTLFGFDEDRWQVGGRVWQGKLCPLRWQRTWMKCSWRLVVKRPDVPLRWSVSHAAQAGIRKSAKLPDHFGGLWRAQHAW